MSASNRSDFQDIQKLIETIDTLRAPGGCPWDHKQDSLSAARYLMDEAGELVEAALEGDVHGMREELGDLLFMVAFSCRILDEKHPTTLHDVAREGNEKLIRRHPHVFGELSARDVGESQERWNRIKAEEKRARGIDPDKQSLLKDMPASTAPTHQAYRYQKDAARAGFDWPDISGVKEKLQEELSELEEAAASGDKDAIEHELGDVLFSLVNLARWHKIQPDMALRKANNRFRERFHLIEADFASRDTDMKNATLEELETSWQRAKRRISGETDEGAGAK